MRSITNRHVLTSILCIGSLALGWTAATMQAQSSEFNFDPSVKSTVEMSESSPNSSELVPANEQIDFDGFVLLASTERDERARRRVPLEKFLAMSHEPNTIILDTRSKSAFNAAHLIGAVHLNFSDFTADKLAAVIPDKETRVLIYCNNNFTAGKPDEANSSDTTASDDPSTRLEAMRFASKSPALALNIPTYINLRGYDYKNVYELADAVAVNDPRVTFAGTSIDRPIQQQASADL